MVLCDNEFVDSGLELVVEETLLLKLRVVAEQKVCLAVENLTCELSIFVKVALACTEMRMDSYNAVKSHNWIWSEHKVLGIALLGLVWIVQHILLMQCQISFLCDIL